MKKFLTLVIFAAWGAAVSAQSTIYSNTFAGGFGTWTTVDNTGDSAGVWQYKNAPFTLPSSGSSITFNSATASNGYALFLSDAATNDNKPENADLLSPAINCSSQSYVFLEFDQYFQQYQSSVGSVYVSTDSVNWTQVYSVDATTANADHQVLDISSLAANQATVYLKFNYQGDWDYFWEVDDIKLVSPPSLDVSVDTITTSQYVGLGTQSVTGTITNRGGTTINSVTLSYTDNGGVPVTQTFTGLSISPLGSYNFSFSQPITVNAAVEHTIVVTSSAPNNNTDVVPSNDTWTKSIIALSQVPVKNVLLEEFTTAKCQYCPDGTTRLRHILENNTNMIGVAIHAGFLTDSMTTADHTTLATAYTDFAPALMVDRTYYESESGVNIAYYYDPNDRWEPYAQARKTVTVPASIIADNEYDPNTRLLTVNASAKFYSSITDDFRINAYIVEDSVTGTGAGYNQVNGSNGDNTSEWYQAGNPIVGFEHRHVLREMLGGPWGTTGVIDATTTDGGVYTKQYTYTLPARWRDSKITVVVLVQHYASNKYDRQIINALEMPLNSSGSTGIVSGISEVNNAVNSIALYPNPASDAVNIHFSLNASSDFSLEVYDMVGRLITTSPAANLAQGEYTTRINTADFSNGVYFIAAKDGNKTVQTLKFVISK